MVLRVCKCGTKAYDEEDLELFVLNKQCKYGRRNKCKVCASKESRASQGYLSPKKSAPKGTYTSVRGQTIFRRYGLSEKAHAELLDSRGNCCELCGSTKRLVIDHCHDTERIRGVLCNICNSRLGYFGDNIEGAEKVLTYLKNTLT